jgi:NTP pyrophosphatase (non-canonical NTP hydrolase)
LTKDKPVKKMLLCDAMLISTVLNALSMTCRAEADHWYHDPVTHELMQLNVGERMALIHSEISEAFEAERKDLMSDHLPEFKGVEEELADALIRIFDYAGDHNLRLGEAFVAKLKYNRMREDHTDAARSLPGGKKF